MVLHRRGSPGVGVEGTEAVTVSDPDIWRSARLLIDQHGDEAPVHAAMRVDAMLEVGDLDGRAVEDLLRREPMADDLDIELAREVLRQGELRLGAQLQIALAADARAMTLAGLFTAAAAVARGFGAGALEGETPRLAFGAGAIAMGAALVAASMLCVAAAWPGPIWPAGNRPESWWSDGVEERPLADCLRRESANYDRSIVKNRAALRRNAWRLQWGAALGAVSPLIGLVVWAAR